MITKGKEIGSIDVTDEELLESIKNTPNIRQALIKVGLAPKGGNYNRALKLKGTLL
jgi:hypothetical protein